ncbi:hypothetical protein C2G38_2179926 [Gigaspora rosea]|uniref:Uncharacterized protein n=1 Tax=Gigaspora rosea TaxID=44941 RepID=A0A397VDW0_9GLOM|nr:hypothetical protein C2G38_2179926 [Gigaspora rosea]
MLDITIILDERFNKVVPKPVNNHPGYDIKYQWAVRVRGTVQTLLAEKYWSIYHVHCLYAGFGERIETDDGYYRPRIHKSQMAICFDC